MTERRRILLCVGGGTAVAAALASVAVWQLAVLVGWSVTASAFLAWVWRDVADLDAARTSQVATLEDDSRSAARALTVTAAVASLVGVLFGLSRASHAAVGLEAELIAASLATVTLSWLVVHGVFTLRYAHLYYTAPVGGVGFPGDGEPAYRDFAYLAYTVGMTYQVADTDITDADIRRTLLGHALLSYVFGATIIAVAINVVAGLV